MNPFDLHGPDFLLFYGVFATVLLVAQAWLQRALERPAPRPGGLNDPYRIAYLRGGAPEALRVAALGLIERELLRVVEDKLEATVSRYRVNHPIDQTVVHHFATARAATSVYACNSFADLELAPPLESLGLLPDAAARDIRLRLAGVAIALLAVTAGVKVLIALERGRSNVLFLIALAAIAIAVSVKMTKTRHTRAGKAALADLRELFAGIRHRPVDRGAAVEVCYLAAIFGISALAAAPGFAHAGRLFPEATAASTFSATCGSVSSCGSSCGGGGGDGGCGGGCGGCGS